MKAVEKIEWFTTLEAQVLFLLHPDKFVPWQMIFLKAVPGCSRYNFLFLKKNPPGEHDQSTLCEILKELMKNSSLFFNPQVKKCHHQTYELFHGSVLTSFKGGRGEHIEEIWKLASCLIRVMSKQTSQTIKSSTCVSATMAIELRVCVVSNKDGVFLSLLYPQFRIGGQDSSLRGRSDF